MDLATIFKGIGAVVLAAGGIYIAIHEARRRERKTTQKEIKELSDNLRSLSDLLVEQSGEVEALTRLLLEQRRYIYKLVVLMTDAGMNPPEPPPAPSFDKGEYDTKEEP